MVNRQFNLVDTFVSDQQRTQLLQRQLQTQIQGILSVSSSDASKLMSLLILSCLDPVTSEDVSRVSTAPELKLPSFDQALELITLKQKKKPWHNYKRGRKRHGMYRKQIWCKTEPKNTYEPRIVPQFRFNCYRTF